MRRTGDSIWKKEIRLGRKAPQTVEPWEVREFVIPDPKEHWWNKEISFSRRPRAGAEPGGDAEQPKLLPSSPSSRPPRTLPRPTLPKLPRPAFPKLPRARLPKSSLPKLSRPLLPRLSHPRLPKPSGSSSRGRGDRVVGLKIGGSQIAAASVVNGGRARLEKVARTPLASGVVADGELRDPTALAAALRSFFAEHDLPRRGVRLGIASSRIGVRSFEIAGIDDERQFVNAIRFRAQEALPIPLEEAVLDYRVLDERVGEDGERVCRVVLVVAHRELVERYIEACHLAGLALVGIDLEAFGLLRALAAPMERDGSALVAVSIGHERTTLAVSDGRICEFTRVLEWGGWVLNVALARVLDSTPAEVELVKRSLSLLADPVSTGLTPEQAGAATEALRHGVESLARELVSSLTYYQSQPDSLGIGEVVITGGTARLTGLAEELERLLGVPVRVGDPLGRLEVADSVDESELGSLAVAIGLGIED